MKYEEIKVGDVFIALGCEERVISRSDEYRTITTIDPNATPTAWTEEDLHLLKPIEEEATLELVSKAVKEIGNFTIEKTESGLIILTPLTND